MYCFHNITKGKMDLQKALKVLNTGIKSYSLSHTKELKIPFACSDFVRSSALIERNVLDGFWKRETWGIEGWRWRYVMISPVPLWPWLFLPCPSTFLGACLLRSISKYLVFWRFEVKVQKVLLSSIRLVWWSQSPNSLDDCLYVWFSFKQNALF